MAVKPKCKKMGKILVLGYFGIKQLCGTISVVLTVTVNVFSPHATLMSYIYIMFVHYIKLLQYYTGFNLCEI